jgi:SAM-dependent methyltransferase
VTGMAADARVALLSPAAAFDRLLAAAVGRHAAGAHPAPALVRTASGSSSPLPVERWVAPADGVDAAILADAEAPVLDIGCGPGRHLELLAAAGRDSLGVDLSPLAVRLARERGGAAVPGSIFEEIPRAGSWRTALLLDGNIGIGGSPGALLRRVAGVLVPGGTAIVEVDAPGSEAGRTSIRLEAPGLASHWFPWARVSADEVEALAARSGFRVEATQRREDRWFARLTCV